MSISINANIEMKDPARLIRRVCRHWAHKLKTEYTDTDGKAVFENGVAYFKVEPNYLSIHLSADTQDALDELQEVLDRHLVPMAKPENVAIKWIL